MKQNQLAFHMHRYSLTVFAPHSHNNGNDAPPMMATEMTAVAAAVSYKVLGIFSGGTAGSLLAAAVAGGGGADASNPEGGGAPRGSNCCAGGAWSPASGS